MLLGKDVVVLSRKAKVEVMPEAEKRWGDGDTCLRFRKAYRLTPTGCGEGLVECRFQVRDRAFEDLSFLDGETIHEYPDDCEVRLHADGTRFLFSYVSIPTFDSSDREWDSVRHTAAYTDQAGIHLICCRHGYKIPRIEVYVGLIGSNPEFDEWMKRLNA